MEKILSYVSDTEHYTSDACIVWCFDDRFSRLLEGFLSSHFQSKNIDLIKIAGGAKDLASPANKTDKKYVLGQIKKSVKLHNSKKIILMCHKACGAYDKKFESDNAETKFYADELNKAKIAVSGVFPDKNIEAYYADFTTLWLV